ncbi:MAG: hypothetical protein ACXVCY_05125 [Pseudobdellovibrionaceae bacterium]
MKKLFLAAALGLGLANSALAAETTQFWYQPNAGTSTFNVGLASATGTAKVNGTETKMAGMPLQMTYAYGLDTNMSVSVSTDFGTQENTSSGVTYKYSGLSDLKGQFLVNSEAWYYGTEASATLGKDKVATSTSEGTRNSGGYSVTPFMGYHSALGFGAKLSYQYFTDRITETSTTDKTTSGGNTLSVEPYWETNYGAGNFGVRFAYGMIADSTVKQSGTADSKSNSYTGYSAGAYVAHKISVSGTILGNLTYVNVPEFEIINGVKYSVSGTNISAGYRMVF